MTREAALDRISQLPYVSRETVDRLDAYVDALLAAQSEQNLISANTADAVWTRHILDSAQLLQFTPPSSVARWLDIGSGAGLPGLVLAILSEAPITLVEPRRLRSDFLQATVRALGLHHVQVAAMPLARLEPFPAGLITARAVASLPKLIAMAKPFADLSTVWVLPKGRSAASELASLPKAWHASWTMMPSLTDPESAILVGRRFAPRVPNA